MSDRARPGVHTRGCFCAECVGRVATVWDDYQRCPVCRAPIGQPCGALSGAVAGGRPNGVLTRLEVPHHSRKRRKRRKGR